MPPVIPAHRALRDTLRSSVAGSLRLNGELEDVIAEKSRQPGSFHGKVDFSQPPWHAPVASAILDLHAMAREMEAWLRLSQGLPGRCRGGSSENTRKALENVIRLSEVAQDGTVAGHTRDLDRWSSRAEVALGRAEMPVRLPRVKGEPARVCPWCERDTLRMKPLKGIIACVDQGCTDENGMRPRGEMTYSSVAVEWIVVWQNNGVGLPGPIGAAA